MRPSLPAAPEPLRILYVEDNADIQGLILELIEKPGRSIVACADAELAWAHLQGGAFDVLVTDVNLPGSSGIELARRWLAGAAARWVILFTGHEFGAGLESLGRNVCAVQKEHFEQLELKLAEIGERLQRRAPGDG